MNYSPYPIGLVNLEELTRYVVEQLRLIGISLETKLDVILVQLHAEPKPRNGLVAFADGTDWNPGSGEGVYVYYNGIWNFLGGSGPAPGGGGYPEQLGYANL